MIVHECDIWGLGDLVAYHEDGFTDLRRYEKFILLRPTHHASVDHSEYSDMYTVKALLGMEE